MVSSRNSKDRVLTAAAAVLSGNPGASLVQIAEEAGVGRATLYRHFASREELVRALAVRSMQELDEATAHVEFRAKSARHAFELIFEALAPLGERHQFLLRESSLEEDPEFKAESNRQAAETRELVELAKAEGSIGRDVPTAWVLAAVDALIYASWEAVRAGGVARNDAGQLAYRTLMKGLAPKRD